MLQWLYTYVTSFYSQCLICVFSRHMLQVCLFGCCICFTHMLQVFYLDVAYVLQWFSYVLASVSDACFKCFICLQTYVAIVVSRCFKSRSVLHLAPHFLLHRLGVSSSSWRWLGIRCPLPLFLDAGDVRDGMGPTWTRETAAGTGVRMPRLSGRLDASQRDVLTHPANKTSFGTPLILVVVMHQTSGFHQQLQLNAPPPLTHFTWGVIGSLHWAASPAC
jgi:hypothetical protein